MCIYTYICTCHLFAGEAMVARQGRVPGLHPQRRLRQDRGEDQRHLRRSPRLLPANPGGHAFKF